jgi:hypothetical protein
MRAGRALTLAVVCLLASACYRQVVQTGRTPGTTVVQKPWTATWAWGLVAAKPIDVSQQCRSGIATVETQLSVPNWLATLVTLGIYSPRAVTVTCAQGRASLDGLKELRVAHDASQAEREAVFAAAAELSARIDQPVIVRF